MMPVRSARPIAAAAVMALAAAACAGPRAAPLALTAPAPAPVPERRAFEVPGHGALEVAIPPGWTATVEPGEPPAPATIRLAPPDGRFVALLTPFWNPGEPEDEAARADAAQLFAELARRNALGGSVEKEIALEEIVGEDVHGFWFGATDRELVEKEPGPAEWRHVIQGAAAVGPLVVAFTLLDQAPGPQREHFLELLRGARHAAPGEERAGARLELDSGARTVPLRVRVRGKAWTVLVDLPGFRMFKPRAADEGVGVHVLGQHPETEIVVSVTLRAAEGARDAGSCREVDLGKVRAAVPGIRDLRVATIGEAARALYLVPDVRGKPVSQAHAHAWLFREGVCVNLHVSKADPAPEDAERLDRILASARFGEEL